MNFRQEEIRQQELLSRVEYLERELQEKNRQLELINQVGGLLTSELELEKVVQKVTDIATKISKAQFGALFYNKLNEKGEVYTLYTLSGARREDFAHFPMIRKTAVFAPTLNNSSIVRSDDITKDPRYGKNKPYSGMPEGHLPVRSYMAVPIATKSGKVLGGLFFGHAKPGMFTQQEEDLVQSIASQAAVAIDNALLYEANLEAEQRKSREQIVSVLESITDGFFTIDNDWVVTYWNQEAERVSGIKKAEALNQDIRKVIGQAELNSLQRKISLSITRQKALSFTSYYPTYKTWLNISAYPSKEGLSVYFKDITKQKHTEELELLSKKVLELNVKPDTTLEHITSYYLRGLERIHPGMLCSVLSLTESKLYIVAAPSLSESYQEAVNGILIGPEQGSCGTAAFYGKKVVVRDINYDPKWEVFRSFAQKEGIKASWSMPIVNSAQQVLGTFAIYYKEPRVPTPEEEYSIEITTNLLQIIVENKSNEVALRQSKERYDLATAATKDLIWEWDLVSGKFYFGFGFEEVFDDWTNTEKDMQLWGSHTHPDDRERVLTSIKEALDSPAVSQWQEEYRFLKKSGIYGYVLDQAYIVRDHNQKATRMVGAMHDVSDQKRYEEERELLIEELTQNNSDLRQFSYITSHNLRAPLANLQGLLKLIRMETIVDPTSKMLVEKFREATLHLNHTLTDLLDILVIKNNTGLKAEPVQLNKSVEEVTSSIWGLIQESNASITSDFSEGEYVYVNPSYLHSILLNLFTNAIKYRSLERSLRIHLQTKVEDKKYLTLYFSDNGLGIDLKKYGDRIFGLYQRFHVHDNSKGIGLYLTQSQIIAMGGRIMVESEVGKGTTFIIKLKKQQFYVE